MQIGKLMKSGQAEEAEAIKQEVEKANDVADSAEEAFEKVRLDSGATRSVYTNPNIHVSSLTYQHQFAGIKLPTEYILASGYRVM